ncbi:MAG: IPT/TIG domain-containing protein [Candidatus Paceibacterota bacterium]|jgi:hypothetical protein
MSKINTKSIYLGVKIGLFVALGLMVLPLETNARQESYVSGYRNPAPVQEERITVRTPDPEDVSPFITSISPDEAKATTSTKTITITGGGFTPSSVVKVNGSNRHTTFIDNSHLLAQANAYDLSGTNESFYLTVWNANGEYSNAAKFTVKGTVPVANNNNINYNGSNNSAPINYYPGNIQDVEEDPSLASSVILGGNTFLPTGIVQWVLVAILIVFIIVLGRKVLGTREHYDNTPLKHA